jgi:hypothetical protein
VVCVKLLVLSCAPAVLVDARLLNCESAGEEVITAEVELAIVQCSTVLLLYAMLVLSALKVAVTFGPCTVTVPIICGPLAQTLLLESGGGG